MSISLAVFGLVPLLGLALAVLVVGVTVALTGTRHPTASLPEAARRARRHAGAVSAVAWVLAVVVLLLGAPLAQASVSGLAQGVALGLVPAFAGLAFAGVHAVGEVTWPRPSGTVRRAALVPRTVGDIAPRGLRRTLWGWGAALTTVLIVCGSVATEGRLVSRAVAGGTSTSGPFPGWFYGVPLLVAAAVVLLSTEGVLRLVAGRPAVTDAAPEWDLALRRLSAHRVLRGGQLVLGLTTAGVLMVAGAAVRSVGTDVALDGTQHTTAVAVVGGTLMVLAGLAALGAVGVAAVPGRPARLAPAPAAADRAT